jgi:hypothetical protein
MNEIQKLKMQWEDFKHMRGSGKGYYFSVGDKCFITIKDREKIIDYLFKYIKEKENGQKNQKD